MVKRNPAFRTAPRDSENSDHPDKRPLTQYQLEVELRRRIQSGIYPPGTKLPSLKDVEAGNDPLGIAAGSEALRATRDAMRTTLQHLKRDKLIVTSVGRKGTIVQPPADCLPPRAGGRFIVLIQNAVPYEFMSRLSHGIITYLHDRNANTKAYASNSGFYLLSMSSEDDCERESELLDHVTASGVASGVLLLPARHPEHNLDQLRRCASRIPIVLVGAGIDRIHTIEHRIPLISHDDVQIGREAANLVLKELGYSTLKAHPPPRIPIYLLSEDSYTAVTDRVRGFSEIMRKTFGNGWRGENHDSIDRNVHLSDERRQDAGSLLADRLRRHGVLVGHKTRPIIVCTTDLTAVGALKSLQSELRVGRRRSRHEPKLKRNQTPLKVPDEVMVLGIDGESFGKQITPRLASFKIDHQALGRTAAESLIQMIEGNRELPLEILLSPQPSNALVGKGSTAVSIRSLSPDTPMS